MSEDEVDAGRRSPLAGPSGEALHSLSRRLTLTYIILSKELEECNQLSRTQLEIEISELMMEEMAEAGVAPPIGFVYEYRGSIEPDYVNPEYVRFQIVGVPKRNSRRIVNDAR